MSKDKIVDAKVTKPTFINGVLHFPGELAKANLTELGVSGLDAKNMSSLDPAKGAGEAIEQVPVAAVSPHAPNPEAPQGLPPGSVISGTGRTLSPAGEGEEDLAREMVPPAPPKTAVKAGEKSK